MGIVGCGLMLAGLIAWAVFAEAWISILIIIFGFILTQAASWKKLKKEEAANSWRAAYPKYKY